ncbi:MAG TPA: KTSC domain-containing protein [Acidimicrobiales bacterium]|nr:KTSC domain-containing protein [Acidimicrobiales bacterium]
MTELEWIDMDSSTVANAAYDPDTETIYVRFKEGGTYSYDQCPPHMWAEFTAPGQSPGKYVNETLRYKPYHKLDG